VLNFLFPKLKSALQGTRLSP